MPFGRTPCPLPEQQRIAANLDASCAAIDAAVAAKRLQLETLDALRKSIIQRAVTRGISARVALELTGNAWMEQILDETAILACAAYVDLNPIRSEPRWPRRR